MEKEKKVIENVSEADQDKVKIAISRWNVYLFSKESDKNLFDYFLESTKKSNILTQYATVFLEQCIIFALNKSEDTPMHHNMRLKQSFQFLVDNTSEFQLKEEIFNQLCEKSLGLKKTKIPNLSYLSGIDRWYTKFVIMGSHELNKTHKEKELVKFILENVLEKSSLDTFLNYYNKVEENVLDELGSIFASSLLTKIEKEPSLSDDIILSIHYMENKVKQIALIDNLLLCPKITQSELLNECWSIYSEEEKELVIGKSLTSDTQSPALETLPDYTVYVKNTLEADLINSNIINHSTTIKNKKKIELYFSLLEELYEQSETEQTEKSIQNYAREMYIKIIEQKRPDLTKGLISIKAEKSIIQTEDVPLFVYQVMQTFPKVMAYHLVTELLGSVKKAGKIKEFSDVFNTSKSFEVGQHKFQFNEDMKNEIKYIYHEFLSTKFAEETKNSGAKPIKRLKI